MKFLTTIGLIWVLVFCLTAPSCPTRTDIEKAAKWGYDTSERTREAQRIAVELYNAGKVGQSSKDQFFDATKVAFDVLEAYNNEVSRQNDALKAGTQTALGAKAIFQSLLSGNVLNVMNKVITALNLMDPTKANNLFSIIRAVATGLLQVFNVFGVPSSALVPIKT